MTLILREDDVRGLLTMPMAIEAVETAFQRLAGGSAVNHSRQRLHSPGQAYLHYMAAADSTGGMMGLKMYTSSRQGLRFLIPLFDAPSGELLALIEADYLGQMRTGAASGVATRLMSRADSRRAGILGTGRQARTQLEAIAHVRKLESARVYGRDAERRARFAAEMSAKLQFPVEVVDNPEAAVREMDIIVTATASSEPVLPGRWLAPGAHINAIGANFPNKRELDSQAVHRAGIIAADSVAQSREEAGDLIQAFQENAQAWNRVIELAEIVAGRQSGRDNSDQITLFKSNGIAIEDILTAERVYAAAIEKGIGQKVDLWRAESGAGAAGVS
jgi:ornithine cyclodeaminase/alanine dehydrogenase-like protein (mu-crystallin family)